MVCFDILLGVPLGTARQTLGNQLRLERICKNFSADSLGSFEKNGYRFFRLIACDKDAVGILRDVPSPFFCIWVRSLRTGTYLYSNFQATAKSIVPPREPVLLQDVYWSATKLEKCHIATAVRTVELPT